MPETFSACIRLLLTISTRRFSKSAGSILANNRISVDHTPSDDEIFPAHRNIVCPQSKYFEVACDGRFKEGNGQITLDSQDPILVKKTLEFLYTGSYTYDTPPTDAKLEPLPEGEIERFAGTERQTSIANPRMGESYFHAQMYAQGDYFQIYALKCKAKQCFRESFMANPDRDSFTSAVVEVYSSTAESDRVPRDLVVQLTTDNLPLLRRGVNPILDGDLLDRVPSFMRDICLSAVERCAQLQRDSGEWG
ncbi:BTB/POZ domain-containing protein [Aspergillus novofumigatus IBT 16806]|uniref:BTB/POZ domain protein n=1 Tax=Aspergillus novofumigatus (strain IBT 16806) TaxID=1392255 RepID=A0A2I1BYZ9_ASPN1|nr:BTB/POZ domain protein [Aspergillus novofumigatus IBT 16806]PKX90606.1 BTB/POZ domain protein [Aspergillus novofumigatus IBT 16806]